MALRIKLGLTTHFDDDKLHQMVGMWFANILFGITAGCESGKTTKTVSLKAINEIRDHKILSYLPKEKKETLLNLCNLTEELLQMDDE